MNAAAMLAIFITLGLAGCSSVVAPPGVVANTRETLDYVTHPIPLIYVSGFYCHCVKIYKQAGRQQSPVGTIATGPGDPSGLFVTPDNLLWVAMGDGPGVEVFQRGQPKPIKILTDPGEYAFDVAVDTDGTVYVGNAPKFGCCEGTVSVYKHGSLTPTSKLNVPGSIAVQGLTLDNRHDLFVTGEARHLGRSFVDEFEAGSTIPKRLPFAVSFARGIQVDLTTDILVADTFKSAVKLFAQGQKYPESVIQISNDQPLYVALTKDETHVYVEAGKILEYTYPDGRLVNVITAGLPFYPSGIAVSPPAPL